MLKLHRFSTRYVDLEIGSDRNVDIRIVERPGLWMTSDQRDQLISDLREVVANGVEKGTLDYGIFTGDKTRLSDSIVTVLYEKRTRRPVGFNVLAILPVIIRGREEEVLHLGLAMMSPDYRGKGLSWALYALTVLLMLFHRQLRPFWISNVTQVPSVLGLVGESFANVFPSARGATRRSYLHLVIARQIMHRHRHVFGVGPEAEFDSDRFIIRNAYTGGSDNLKKTFDEAPKHRDEAYNEMCRNDLDYARGDDFLQIGQYTLSIGKSQLLKSVPRRSLPAILYSGSFLLVSSLFLPVLHWFAASTPMGDLRPWRAGNK
jgi:hypothetical protein